MRVRDTWLLDDVQAFEDPTDWALPSDLGVSVDPVRGEEDETFRAVLIEDAPFSERPRREDSAVAKRARARAARRPQPRVV